MKIFKHIAQMKPYIQRGDWTGLEESFHTIAVKLSDPVPAQRIQSLNFVGYQAAISAALDQAKKLASRLPVRAVYFEYDLDNDWDSAFFLCASYEPEVERDDDWACDYLETISGPSFPEAGSIYDENGFDDTDLAKGSTLYLIARTVAAFGRAVYVKRPWKVPICIAYHDQDPIVRISE